MSSDRKTMQRVMHQIDMYAKPVTLTYNGQRAFHTVPGAICSIISLILISYQSSTTFMKFVDHRYAPYSRQRKELALDPFNPPAYDISNELFNVFSQIKSSDPTITDVNQYFEGVYVQANFDIVTQKTSFNYYPPIPCSQVYSGLSISPTI